MKLGQWVGFATLLLIAYILWQMRQLMLLLFTAIVLAIALNMLVRWFKRRQVSRGMGILLSVGPPCEALRQNRIVQRQQIAIHTRRRVQRWTLKQDDAHRRRIGVEFGVLLADRDRLVAHQPVAVVAARQPGDHLRRREPLHDPHAAVSAHGIRHLRHDRRYRAGIDPRQGAHDIRAGGQRQR